MTFIKIKSQQIANQWEKWKKHLNRAGHWSFARVQQRLDALEPFELFYVRSLGLTFAIALAVAFVCTIFSIYILLATLVVMGFVAYAQYTLFFPKIRELSEQMASQQKIIFENGVTDYLGSTSQTLAESSSSLGKTSVAFNRGVDDQLQAVQASLAIMSDFSAIIEDSADSAKSSYRMTVAVNQMTNSGREVVTKSEEAMRDIEKVNEQLEEMAGIIGHVESQTDTIDQIMREAKILAFNAMVEASRAGESGRGFAVVAQSLQDLSEMCSTASKQIRTLARSGTEKSDFIISDIKTKLNETKQINAEFVKTFENITDGVGSVSTLLEKINDAAIKQESGIVLCSEALARVYATTASNRKVSDRTGYWSRLLQAQSEELEKTRISR